jgi:transcription initiation factor IIE alpha subunit
MSCHAAINVVKEPDASIFRSEGGEHRFICNIGIYEVTPLQAHRILRQNGMNLSTESRRKEEVWMSSQNSVSFSQILTSIKSKIRRTAEALGKLLSEVNEEQKLKA